MYNAAKSEWLGYPTPGPPLGAWSLGVCRAVVEEGTPLHFTATRRRDKSLIYMINQNPPASIPGPGYPIRSQAPVLKPNMKLFTRDYRPTPVLRFLRYTIMRAASPHLLPILLLILHHLHLYRNPLRPLHTILLALTPPTPTPRRHHRLGPHPPIRQPHHIILNIIITSRRTSRVRSGPRLAPALTRRTVPRYEECAA